MIRKADEKRERIIVFWSYGMERLLLLNLPEEVLYNIVAQLPVEDSLSLSRTCKKAYPFIKHNERLWKFL